MNYDIESILPVLYFQNLSLLEFRFYYLNRREKLSIIGEVGGGSG